MDNPTSWTLIHAVVEGSDSARSEFHAKYEGMVRSVLAARWRGRPLVQFLDDAQQEVFLQCLREGGAVTGADSSRAFRPFLRGVVINIARKFERQEAAKRPLHDDNVLDQVEDCATAVSALFDREWAKVLVQEAVVRQHQMAKSKGDEALRRVELLRLRVSQGKPIREIAEVWGVKADWLHHQYATARNEFRKALESVVAFHNPGNTQHIEQECRELLLLLKEE